MRTIYTCPRHYTDAPELPFAPPTGTTMVNQYDLNFTEPGSWTIYRLAARDPIGFQQMADLYEQYRVVGCKFRFSASVDADTFSPTRGLVLYHTKKDYAPEAVDQDYLGRIKTLRRKIISQESPKRSFQYGHSPNNFAETAIMTIEGVFDMSEFLTPAEFDLQWSEFAASPPIANHVCFDIYRTHVNDITDANMATFLWYTVEIDWLIDFRFRRRVAWDLLGQTTPPAVVDSSRTIACGGGGGADVTPYCRTHGGSEIADMSQLDEASLQDAFEHITDIVENVPVRKGKRRKQRMVEVESDESSEV